MIPYPCRSPPASDTSMYKAADDNGKNESGAADRIGFRYIGSRVICQEGRQGVRRAESRHHGRSRQPIETMKSDLVNYAAAEWRPWLARSHDEPRSIYNRASMRNRVLVACVVMGVSLAAGFATFRILRRVPKESGRILAQTSDDWGSIPFGNRECALVNNTWNRAAAGQEFEQFVFVEEEAGRMELGWRWRAPWHFWPTVVSQPQIVCGNKPWDPKTRPDDGFPFRAGTRRVTVNFDVHL